MTSLFVFQLLHDYSENTMKTMKSNRSIRLLNLVMEIKSQPGQTVPMMLAKCGISKSQFYEDKRELQQLGFSFHYDRNGKRFVLDSDRFFPVDDLTLSERLILLQVIRKLADLRDYAVSYHAFQVARKLITSLEGPLREAANVLFDNWVLQEGFGCKPQILDQLQQAWTENRRILMDYRKPNAAQIRQYEFDPYMIFFEKRALYVEGYSVTRKGFRRFRISRIEKVRFTAMHFAVREEYDFGKRFRNTFTAFAGEAVQKVVVRFNNRVRPYIEEACRHGSQTVEALEDGDTLYTVEVAEPREVLWWALSWGSNAEILKPDWLRKEAEEEVKKMLDHYRS